MEKYRHEYKHYISIPDFITLSGKISFVVSPDGHMKNGSYFVRSLYFDDPQDKALREKLDGNCDREKFRIRFYDMNDGFIRLEKKSKRSGLCMKRSAPLTRKMVDRLLVGDYAFLAEENDPLLTELYAKMSGGLLRPKLTVDYERKAYVFPAGNVRVTFDYNIRSDENIAALFDPAPAAFNVPSACSAVIMEIKYDEFLPQFIADILQLDGRQTGAFSKYAAGRFSCGTL
ncbi:MAG: polyphosphate polymerase domain-containing protein [Oscillospiraceae bacterium]|nr:polyphosphate polymerase domain-containing protein [Oscillospiraceae bacterium]